MMFSFSSSRPVSRRIIPILINRSALQRTQQPTQAFSSSVVGVSTSFPKEEPYHYDRRRLHLTNGTRWERFVSSTTTTTTTTTTPFKNKDDDLNHDNDKEEDASVSISPQDLKLAMDAVIEKHEQQQEQQQQAPLDGDFNSSDTNDTSTIAVAATSDSDMNNTTTAAETTIPGTQSGGKKLAIVMTCTVCDTRMAKQFSEHSYKHGVVLVKCPGCANQHLIADRLGFFEDESWDIESAMKRMNRHKVKTVTNDNVLEVTLADVLGSKLQQAVAREKLEQAILKGIPKEEHEEEESRSDSTTTTTSNKKKKGKFNNNNNNNHDLRSR